MQAKFSWSFSEETSEEFGEKLNRRTFEVLVRWVMFFKETSTSRFRMCNILLCYGLVTPWISGGEMAQNCGACKRCIAMPTCIYAAHKYFTLPIHILLLWCHQCFTVHVTVTHLGPSSESPTACGIYHWRKCRKHVIKHVRNNVQPMLGWCSVSSRF